MSSGIERKKQKKKLKKVTRANLAMVQFIYNDVFTEKVFFQIIPLRSDKLYE